MAARVVLLMPSDLIRDAIALVLKGMADVEVVAQSWSVVQGAALIKHHQPDLVIVDAGFPEPGAAVGLVRRACPQARVLMLVDSPSPETVKGAFVSGADDYGFKTGSTRELELAILRVMS